MTQEQANESLQHGLERGEKMLKDTLATAHTANDFNRKMAELYGIGLYILSNDVLNTKNLKTATTQTERLTQIMSDIHRLVTEPVDPSDIETYKIPEQSEAF